jgi:2-polyprenyl-3-methyl-5-hydroxy-6-metoxy-1,4-benzoquinol methylase
VKHCICCALDTVSDLGMVDAYPCSRCHRCGYVRYAVGRAMPDASVFQGDHDYMADLYQGTDHRTLMQWHHYKALETFAAVRLLDAELPRALDVGCFNGFFVKELLDRGYDAYGMDFNSAAIEHGVSQYGLEGRVTRRSLNELDVQEKFDAITLFEVIEHLDDPLEILSLVKEAARPGGMLVLSCPNAHAVWRPPADFPPHHVSRFTANALTALVRRAGFEPQSCHVQTSSFLLMKHYLGAVARKGNSTGAPATGGSMRGGQIRPGGIASGLRAIANKNSRVLSSLFSPVDQLMKFAGRPYLGLLIVARAV